MSNVTRIHPDRREPDDTRTNAVELLTEARASLDRLAVLFMHADGLREGGQAVMPPDVVRREFAKFYAEVRGGLEAAVDELKEG